MLMNFRHLMSVMSFNYAFLINHCVKDIFDSDEGPLGRQITP